MIPTTVTKLVVCRQVIGPVLCLRCQGRVPGEVPGLLMPDTGLVVGSDTGILHRHGLPIASH